MVATPKEGPAAAVFSPFHIIGKTWGKTKASWAPPSVQLRGRVRGGRCFRVEGTRAHGLAQDGLLARSPGGPQSLGPPRSHPAPSRARAEEGPLAVTSFPVSEPTGPSLGT